MYKHGDLRSEVEFYPVEGIEEFERYTFYLVLHDDAPTDIRMMWWQPGLGFCSPDPEKTYELRASKIQPTHFAPMPKAVIN